MGALAEAIERSAAPAAVDVAIARLLDGRPGMRGRLEDDDGLRDGVIAVTAASRSLTQLLVTDPDAIDEIAEPDRRQPVDGSGIDGLARWKRHEMLRIAVRDLTGRDGLEATGAALAQMAADVLSAAVRLAGAEGRLSVIGMGKLGASELNYASDIDVMLVGDDESDGRRVLDIARSCFRVDANLRPEGRDGPLVRSLASYESYWERWAKPWEFQALLKARPVAGNEDLGAAFARAAAARVWERPFDADDLREVRAMKTRAESEVARRGLTDREIKLGRGGIRDIEFAVQLLQLVHGRHDPALRVAATLPALSELAAAGYVDGGDATAMALAYRMLRIVEHRLQLVDEQQVHAVPTDPAAIGRLARVVGYRDELHQTATAHFERDLRRQQATVRAIHERLYFRPLLEAFAGSPGAMTAEAAEARLAAFGFADADRTRLALTELTRGLTRSSRLMQQLLPLLLQWLADGPDPDLGLLGLRTLSSGPHPASRLVEAFRESPELARRLCLVLATSQLLGRRLEQHPEMIRLLGDDVALAPRSRDDLLQRTEGSTAWRGSDRDRAGALLRLTQRETLRIACRDVLDLDDVRDTGAELTDLAEAVLEAALDSVGLAAPVAIIAMGRFGGRELSYASDLDVLLVTGSPEEAMAVEEGAEELLRLVNGRTPAARLFALDANLRPEGKQGALVRSLDGYASYYRRWAQTWERQALVRARVAAGDRDLGAQFLTLIEPFVWAPLSDAESREIRRMKARIERERMPADEDPQFHLKLGRGSLSDIEWTAQLLQLRHGVRSPSTISALDSLEAASIIDGADAGVLREAYRFCERTRNRWFLIKGAPGDALPTQAPQLARLARSLGTNATDLREEYRRVTRRARAVFEHLFYGLPS